MGTADGVPVYLSKNSSKNLSIVSLPVPALAAAACAYFSLGYSLDMLLEFTLMIFVALPFSGVHMLLSHLWLCAMLVTMHAENRPFLSTFIGTFGYIAICVPWYTGLAACVAKSVVVPRLVFPNWATWCILQAGQYSEKAQHNCTLFDKRNELMINKFLFTLCFHLLDFICHLFPAVVAIRWVDATLLPLVVPLVIAVQVVWFLLIYRRHFKVYFGALPYRVFLLEQKPPRDSSLVLGFFNLPRFRSIYGVDSELALAAFGQLEVCGCFVVGWVVGGAMLVLSQLWPQLIADYVALGALFSDETVIRGWIWCGAVAVPPCLAMVFTGIPCAIGLPMDV